MIELKRFPSQILSLKLTNIKFSQTIIQDLEKLNDINKIHVKKKYLLQSYILNLVAVWQVFIEDLLEFGVNEIIKKQTDSNTIEILKTNLNENLKRFNTPNTNNIDKIFKTVLAIEKITNTLELKEMSLEKTKFKINYILKIRHQIAHTSKSTENLTLNENFEFMNHLFEVSKQLELKVKEIK
jgi:hypothetical protein